MLTQKIYYLENVIEHLLKRLNELELEFRDFVIEQ